MKASGAGLLRGLRGRDRMAIADLLFDAGFMVNDTDVWPSARATTPKTAAHKGRGAFTVATFPSIAIVGPLLDLWRRFARFDTWTGLMIPSGCGESTLLNLIVGPGEPTGGEIRLDGRPLRGAERPWGRNNAPACGCRTVR